MANKVSDRTAPCLTPFFIVKDYIIHKGYTKLKLLVKLCFISIFCNMSILD